MTEGLAILAGTVVGAVAGLGIALVVTTLVNANCDSFTEIAVGCSRLPLGMMALLGAGGGAAIGAVVGLVVGARYRDDD